MYSPYFHINNTSRIIQLFIRGYKNKYGATQKMSCDTARVVAVVETLLPTILMTCTQVVLFGHKPKDDWSFTSLSLSFKPYTLNNFTSYELLVSVITEFVPKTHHTDIKLKTTSKIQHTTLNERYSHQNNCHIPFQIRIAIRNKMRVPRILSMPGLTF